MKDPTRILVIEDNSDDQALLMRQLRKAGLGQHVKSIADGKSAMAYLSHAESPVEDLVAIFLDLNLPAISGLKILNFVRSQDRLRKLPVIIMTSSNSPEDLAKCKELGVSCYLRKPITFTTFAKAVADSFHPPTSLGTPRSE